MTEAGPITSATMIAAARSRTRRRPLTVAIQIERRARRCPATGVPSSPHEQPEKRCCERPEEHDLWHRGSGRLLRCPERLPRDFPGDIQRVDEAEEECGRLEGGKPSGQDGGPRQVCGADEVPSPAKGIGENPQDVGPVWQQ